MENEKWLIYANVLKEKLQAHHDFFVDGVGGFRYLTPKDKARVDEITHCIAEIVNTPAVDAVEVVHAEWLVAAYAEDGSIVVIPYRKHQCNIPFCSWCQHHALLNCGEYITSNYCPNCGAKMDGGNEDVNLR